MHYLYYVDSISVWHGVMEFVKARIQYMIKLTRMTLWFSRTPVDLERRTYLRYSQLMSVIRIVLFMMTPKVHRATTRITTSPRSQHILLPAVLSSHGYNKQISNNEQILMHVQSTTCMYSFYPCPSSSSNVYNIAKGVNLLQKLARKIKQSTRRTTTATSTSTPTTTARNTTLHVHFQRQLGRISHHLLLSSSIVPRGGILLLLVKQLRRLSHGHADELLLLRAFGL